MALRKPLVIVSGQVEQLQAGDTLDAPLGGYTSQVLTNDEGATALVIGMAVYIDAADGAKRAKADASGTRLVVGLWASTSTAAAASGICAVDGVLTATTGQWDAVTGDVGGLTPGSRYWLSAATAGFVTKTAPGTVGQYVCRIGLAISTTEMKIEIEDDVLL